MEINNARFEHSEVFLLKIMLKIKKKQSKQATCGFSSAIAASKYESLYTLSNTFK